MTPVARACGLRRWSILVAAAGWSVLPAGAATAQTQVGYNAAVYVARGTYPAERVTGLYLFNGIDFTIDRVRGSVSVPYIWQQTTFDGLTAAPLAGTGTNSGFGDPLIRVDVRVLDDRSRGLQLAIAGSIKPSLVAPDDGFGTGGTDVAAGGSLFTAVGRTSVFADVLFWSYGDADGTDFENSLSYSVGVGRIVGSGRWSAMVSLGGFSKGIDGAPPPLQLSVTALGLVGRRQSLGVTAGLGLNESAGDFSIGLSWRVSR